MSDAEHTPAVQGPPLPLFPETAWRGAFKVWRNLIGDVSECPLPFHYANLLSVISAELGDGVRFQQGTSLFLHFFIFCAGRTGTKKSTATDLTVEHLLNIWPAQLAHKAASSVSSGEGLIRILRTFPNTVLRYDEIADLFKTSNRTGQRIEPLLNQAFGLQPLDANVKTARASLTAQDYYLNILGNGTPDHVRLQLSEELQAGGLLNRFLVFGAEPTGKSMPEMGTPNAEQATLFAAKLAQACAGWRSIYTGRGAIKIKFSKDAAEVHRLWYDRHTIDQQHREDLEAKPLTRLDIYAKKIAAVYCLLETMPQTDPPTTEVLIEVPQIRAALDVIAYCQASMSWLMQSWSGTKSVQQQSEALVERRIESYLRENGCWPERHIYRHLHLGAQEARRAIDALAHAGVLSVVEDRPRYIHYRETCKHFS